MPPNGFNCNCSTRAISSYRVKKENLKVQGVGSTPDVFDRGFGYEMCGSEREHIEKIEHIENKKAEAGDKLSKLGLFENEVRRVEHFKNLCHSHQNNQASKDDRLKFSINCNSYKQTLLNCKEQIGNYSKAFLKDKNNLNNFSFFEIFGNLKHSSIDDLNLSIVAILSYHPELSNGKIFSKVETHDNQNTRAFIKLSDDSLSIREDLADNLNNLFKNIRLNRKDKLELENIDDERLLQTLHHEILHLRADRKNVNKIEAGGSKIRFGEMINEYFSLKRYHELLNIFKIKAKHIDQIANGNNDTFKLVKRFKELLNVVKIEDFDDIELNNKLDWLDPVEDISQYLSRASGVEKDVIKIVVEGILRKDFKNTLNILSNQIKR